MMTHLRKIAAAALFTAFASAQAPEVTPTGAEKLFARMKTLAGKWQEKSSKGWSGSDNVRVIARGSAVLFESSFEDAPDAGMATLVYLDKGRVLMTHYCEARNQPTLVASSISPDGAAVTFTFLSGTGMKSRDDGHMDQVVFRFAGPDSYNTQWTWYSAGKSQLFEEIAHRRIVSDANATGR